MLTLGTRTGSVWYAFLLSITCLSLHHARAMKRTEEQGTANQRIFRLGYRNTPACLQ